MSKVKIKTNDVVAVLDGRKAILLRNAGDALYLNLVVIESRSHEQVPNREMHTDRPGRVHQSAAAFRSSVEVADRHDEAESEFIVGVAKRLDELVAADKHCGLVVVAPPRALGVLRSAYTPAVRAAVRLDHDQDWVHLPTLEIERRLAEA